MILSVSRRTDVPAFYSEWFINRIREGFVYVRNPFNANQISNVNIKSEVVDCIVFWTKNPKPLIPHLDELNKRGYKYYFQFTITPYQRDLEQNMVDKEEIIETFIQLSDKIGHDKVIWRYDPIVITAKYNEEYHLKEFSRLCQKLKSFTSKVVISFLDDYRKVSKNMKGLDVKELSSQDMFNMAQGLSLIAREQQLAIETCAEAIDLGSLGIGHGKCIDGDLIEKVTGYNIMHKDKRDNNRQECGCMKCIDIGQYDSCVHGCLYCYANVNKELAAKNKASHNPQSPILFGLYRDTDVKIRKDIQSLRQAGGLFDYIIADGYDKNE